MKHLYFLLLILVSQTANAQNGFIFLSQSPNVPAFNEVSASCNTWGLHARGVVRSYDIENTSQEFIGMIGFDLGSFFMKLYNQDYLKEYGVYPIARAGLYTSSGINRFYKTDGTFIIIGAHLRVHKSLNGTVLFYPPISDWYNQGMSPWIQVGATWRLL